MAFCMVFVMTVYNTALESGGLTYGTFLTALKGMWIEYAIAFVVVYFVVTRVAKKLTFKIINPQKDNPFFITLGIQCFTVMMMVPTMSLFVTFINHGFTADWFVLWLKSTVLSFPMAFFSQVFFVGPFVRWIFGLIFREKHQKSDKVQESVSPEQASKNTEPQKVSEQSTQKVD